MMHASQFDNLTGLHSSGSSGQRVPGQFGQSVCVCLVSPSAAQGVPAVRVQCHADLHFLRQRRQTGEQREQADFHRESLAYTHSHTELQLRD